MVMTDPIADLLTRIRNANQMKHAVVEIPASKIKAEILSVLKSEGYITDYTVVSSGVQGTIKITLKYLVNNERAVRGLKRISKPGLRVYAKSPERPWNRHCFNFPRHYDRPGSKKKTSRRRSYRLHLVRQRSTNTKDNYLEVQERYESCW